MTYANNLTSGLKNNSFQQMILNVYNFKNTVCEWSVDTFLNAQTTKAGIMIGWDNKPVTGGFFANGSYYSLANLQEPLA